MTHLVVGFGEVGKAVFKVLADHYSNVSSADVNGHHLTFDVLHICFPYSDDFEAQVRKYQQANLTTNGLTIIHSTVPLGTNRKLNSVSSPVRGVHPKLDEGIRTFVKYFGGERAEEASKIFSYIGIKTKVLPSAEECEAGKLWDTTQYGWMIILNKYIYEWCKEKNLDFENVYTDWNKTYNQGYSELGRSEVFRPHLKHMDGAIGGHCVIPNLKFVDSKVSEIIKSKNEELNGISK